MTNNLVKYILDNGGDIRPLIIPSELTNGTGLMNPSIYNDNGQLMVLIRHINYTLYHSEKNKFFHTYGPLQYIHPENDVTLTTYNYISYLDENLNTTKIFKIDTSLLDVKPLWTFIGLEDARLFKWENKLFCCGVRRDTTTNGQGRMELSELEVSENSIKEISRKRIPVLDGDTSYCEKNWVPILDKPFNFIKWTNPTEIIEIDNSYDLLTESAVKSHIMNEKNNLVEPDLRGGSQVIRWKNYYISLVHEVFFHQSELKQKNGTYKHRFVIWDLNFKFIKITDSFSFMTAMIEFSCGMCLFNNNILISFGFQDNAAYVLKIPESLFESIIFEGI